MTCKQMKEAIKNNSLNYDELSENDKKMYTYGNESDCTFFKTKKEAKKDRKEHFGSLYESEAQMDRLIPIYKIN